MREAMPSNPIKTKKKTITKADGTKAEVTIYWFRVEAGHDAEGKRKQIYKSFEKQKDAKAEYAKICNEVNVGTFVAPAKVTLDQYLDEFVVGHVRDLEEASKRNLRDALRPARERFGTRTLQSIAKKDVEDLVEWMTTAGRKRGGKPGTGLGPRTVRLTLGALQSALDMAVSERRIQMNPVHLVKRPKLVKPVHVLWTDAEEAKFFAVAELDRIAAVVNLFALALRPEEVCGIRWTDLDLTNQVAFVGRHVRTMVEGKAVEKTAKTEAGVRALPLDDQLTAELKAWRKQRAAEKLAAGGAYVDGGYVLCDELGAPWLPDKLRRYMRSLMKRAEVTVVTPYEAMRHAGGSRLARSGVAPHVLAAWMGHTSAAFTYDHYAHARPEDLVTARDALTRPVAKSA
jgi:integrase